MTECFNCGVSFRSARLYDAVSDEGIKKVCDKCAREENVPLIKKPTTFQLREAEEKKRFHERASEFRKNSARPAKRINEDEITLREIVDRNYEDRVGKPENIKPRPDLVKNFHWIIMRARRMKKLTQDQLAKELRESVSAIKMAEQGILPEDDYRLVNKIEGILGIRIVKKEFEEVAKPKKSYFNFDRHSSRELTIEDIKEMRKKELEFQKMNSLEKIEDSEDDFEDGDYEEEKEFEDEDSEELSKSEMDRIIFGR